MTVNYAIRMSIHTTVARGMPLITCRKPVLTGKILEGKRIHMAV